MYDIFFNKPKYFYQRHPLAHQAPNFVKENDTDIYLKPLT